ncbi:MAG: hypothetical protein KDB21_15205 [Acidimicrobiales bacterium]|nr:hypothetical protein [Acidimicrobiales bacterium]
MGLISDLVLTIGVVAVVSLPLALSVMALLDAARRPAWVWALAGRRQVVWMAVILFATLTVVGGLIVASIYLLRIRPQLVAVESGRLE